MSGEKSAIWSWKFGIWRQCLVFSFSFLCVDYSMERSGRLQRVRFLADCVERGILSVDEALELSLSCVGSPDLIRPR